MSKILKILFQIIFIFVINQNDSFILNNNNNNIYSNNKYNSKNNSNNCFNNSFNNSFNNNLSNNKNQYDNFKFSSGGFLFVESVIIKWSNASGLDFTDPFGWIDNMVPTEEDDAIIDIQEIYVLSTKDKVKVGSLELGSRVLFGSTEHFLARNYITINEDSKMISVHTSSPIINNYGKYHGTQLGSQISSSTLNSFNKSETIFVDQVNLSSPFLNSTANIYHGSSLSFTTSTINLSNTTFNLFDKSICKFNKSKSNFCNTVLNGDSKFYALEGEYDIPSNIQFRMNDQSNFFIEKSKLTIHGKLVGTKSTIDFESFQSRIAIRDGGNFVINMKVQCRDSALVVKNDSSLTISSDGGEMVLRNSILANKFGKVHQQGNVYLNSGSSISNHGSSTFYISNTIYSSGDKNSNFTNNGTIIITNTNIDSLKIESPIINYGNIVTEYKQKVFITNYIQYNGSTLNLQDETVLISNQPIQIEGGSLYGNATLNASIVHNYGSLGSYSDTCYLYINGDYSMSPYGTIKVLINSLQDYTQIYIKDNAVLRGDLEVKISSKISSKNLKQLDVIQFGELDKYSNAFKKVRFKTFDPENGRETDGNDCAQSISTDRSFSVLFRDCESPLSNRAIIGFCIGLVGTAVLVGAIYNFRKKISSTFNSTRKSFSKSNNSSSDNSIDNNNNNNNNNDNDNNMNNSNEEEYNNNNSISLDILNDNNIDNNNNNSTSISIVNNNDNSIDLINNNNSNNIEQPQQQQQQQPPQQ